jgi:hypothetical protein
MGSFRQNVRYAVRMLIRNPGFSAAVRFANGRQLRLQELREGLAVKVLDLSMAEELDLELLRRELAEFPRR